MSVSSNENSEKRYRVPLDTFIGREDILAQFDQILQSAQPGQFHLLAIKGNSGTGKTFLIEYLSHQLCPSFNLQVGQLSFTPSSLDFRSLLKALEDAFKTCVSPESLKRYRTKRDEYNRHFDSYRASITIHQSVDAMEFSSVTNSALNTNINVNLYEREKQLRAEWSRAFIELAEESKHSLCLFIDNYIPSFAPDSELDQWLWEDVLPKLIKADPYPLIVTVCGWEWPRIDSIDPHNIIRVELKDFNFAQVTSYLEKRQVINNTLSSADSELIAAFYELTRGHPLILDLAVTYFNELPLEEHTAQSLQARRPYLDERAQIEFLEERLLKRLPEPHRTSLERGPILRFIDQAALSFLLYAHIDGTTIKSSRLDDRTYFRFLQYPFINRQYTLENGPLVDQPTFHELVRHVRLDTLKRLHPQTKEQLHYLMVYYYYNEIAHVQQIQESEYINTNPQRKEGQGSFILLKRLMIRLGVIQESRRQSVHQEDVFRKDITKRLEQVPESEFRMWLEYLYHALQVKNLQHEIFELWLKLIAQSAFIGRKHQAKLLLDLIRQLVEEGEPYLNKTTNSYGKFLMWHARILRLDLRWEDSLAVLGEAARIFEQTKNFNDLANCYISLGYCLTQVGKLEQALENFNQVLMFGSQLDDNAKSASLNNIGNICQIQGDLDHALQYEIQALDLIKQSGDSYRIAILLDNIASCYHKKGETERALSYCDQALVIFTQLGDPTKLAECLCTMGEIYREQNEFEKALKYQERALNLSEQVGDSIVIASTLNNIGCVYDALGDFEQALNYYNRSLALIEEMPASATNIAQTVNNIGLVYLFQEKIEQAKRHFERGLFLSEEASNKANIATSCNHLGLVYFHQGKLRQAETIYKRSLSLRKEIGNPADIAQTSHNLGELYLKQAMNIDFNPITAIPKFIYLDPLMLRRAIEQYENALHLYELSGKGHVPDIADELDILSLCYMFLKMQEKAINYSRGARQIREMTKNVPHRVYSGKYSQLPHQITEEMLRKIASQIVHVDPQHTSDTQKYKFRRKNEKRKRHR